MIVSGVIQEADINGKAVTRQNAIKCTLRLLLPWVMGISIVSASLMGELTDSCMLVPNWRGGGCLLLRMTKGVPFGIT